MMNFDINSLQHIGGVWTGSNSIEYHTLGIVNTTNIPHDGRYDPRVYFDNFAFLGPQYNSSDIAKFITQPHHVSGYNEEAHWTESFIIDHKDYELVVNGLERARVSKKNTEVGVFKVSLNYTFTQVNTTVDEYAEIRKWNALKKLSMDEIKLLNLEKEMVHLKLKYGTSNESKLDIDSLFG